VLRDLYIHELNEWPNLTWDTGRLTALLEEVRKERSELFDELSKSCFEELGQNLREEASVQMLTEEVVKTSAIEGEKLDPDQVRSSIARKLGLELGGLRKDVAVKDRNIDGIVNVVLDASHKWKEALTTDRLYKWHGWLFPTGYSDYGKVTVDQWREGPIEVISSPFNKQRVHFVGPEALRLKEEMEKFLQWFEEDQETDLIVKAGIAHLYFVTIHPFDDGNGRIGRAIADLALARADGAEQRFYSMSAQIKHDRKEYYVLLEQTQRGSLDITSWLEWFLKCLIRSVQWAKQALHAVIKKAQILRKMEKLDLNERQQKVMLKFLDGGFGHLLTTSKYKISAKCSPDSANRDLAKLVEIDLLERSGRGKSTSYVIK
jgi:Fic family protein